MTILDEVKKALRVTQSVTDSEIQRLINSAKTDLGIAGVEVPDELDDICTTAIIAYCKFSYGNMEPGDAHRWKQIYDEQKAQLSNATGYTDWGEE